MPRVCVTLIASLGGLIAFSSISLAGAIPGAPAPIAGVGLPALAIGAAGYWLVRKIRNGRGG